MRFSDTLASLSADVAIHAFIRSHWLYACQTFEPTPMMPKLFPRESISMNRREFAKTIAGSTVAMSVPHLLLNATKAAGAEAYQRTNSSAFRNLADAALRTAKKLGASYADLRLCKYHNESIFTREEKV